MKVLKYIILVVLIFVGAFFFFLWKAGMYNEVTVVEQEMGPYHAVYNEYVGDYGKTGMYQRQIYEELKAEGIETAIGFGKYFDNPETIEKDLLKSHVGVMIKENQIDSVAAINKDKIMLTYPRQNYLTVTIDYDSQLSILVGLRNAYPALKTYAEDNGIAVGPAIEVYDMEKKKIFYLFEFDQ